jgi:hypothetical protein
VTHSGSAGAATEAQVRRSRRSRRATCARRGLFRSRAGGEPRRAQPDAALGGSGVRRSRSQTHHRIPDQRHSRPGAERDGSGPISGGVLAEPLSRRAVTSRECGALCVGLALSIRMKPMLAPTSRPNGKQHVRVGWATSSMSRSGCMSRSDLATGVFIARLYFWFAPIAARVHAPIRSSRPPEARDGIRARCRSRRT